MASTGRNPRGLFLLAAGAVLAGSAFAQWVASSPVAAAPELGLILAAPRLLLGALLVLAGCWNLFWGWHAREEWTTSSGGATGYFLVLGALLVWSVLGWTGTKKNVAQAQTIRCRNASKTLYTVLDGYAKEHGGNFPAKLEDLSPTYLPQIPRCRISDSDTGAEYRFTPSADHKHYSLNCGRSGHPLTTEDGVEEKKE